MVDRRVRVFFVMEPSQLRRRPAAILVAEDAAEVKAIVGFLARGRPAGWTVVIEDASSREVLATWTEAAFAEPAIVHRPSATRRPPVRELDLSEAAHDPRREG